MKNPLKSRKFKYGTFATLFTVIFVVVVFIINVIATALVEKYPLEIDLTADSIFELSDDSKSFLKDLQKDVTVTVLAEETDFSSGNKYYQQANEVIKKYAMLSDKVTLQYVNILKNPTFTSNYANQDLKTGDIIVESGSRIKVLTAYDLFNTQVNQYYQTQIMSSRAEQAMTSALMNVTSDKTYKIAMLTGHDEQTITGFDTILANNNYSVITHQMATGDIPEDTDIVFIVAPTRDYSEDELKRIDKFLDNDTMYGKNLVYIASPDQPPLPNLETFLSEWGVNVEDGVVYETNQNNIFNFNPFFAVAEYSSNEAAAAYSERFSGKNIPVTLPASRPLSLAFESHGTRNAKVLLQFSKTTGIVPTDAEESFDYPGNVKGENIPAMILGTQMRYEGTEPLQSHVLVSASVSFFENSLLQDTSIANGEYFTNALANMTEREDTIFIVPKNLSGERLTMTQGQVTTLGAVFVLVLPLGVLVLGIVIWLRRRHL